MVNVSITLDWRSFLALGVAVSAPILVYKMDAPAAESVVTNLVSTAKDYAIARNSNR